MAELQKAISIEGMISGVRTDFVSNTQTLELFGPPEGVTITIPGIIARFRPAWRIRAVCVAGSNGEHVAIDLICNENERPITDDQRLEQEGRLGIRSIYTAPKGAVCESVISKVTDIEVELIRYLATHPELMREMHSEAFEKLVAELLASYGFQVEWTGRNRKTAADVIAFKTDEASGLGNNFIVECKRQAANRPVGIEVARTVYGAKCDENFSNALLVTTSHFEDGVYKFALRRWDFQLRDFVGLVDWLNKYRPRNDGRLHMQDRRLILREDA